MKSTGIVRRVDELGRIVLPIEMRRTLDIAETRSITMFKGKNVCPRCLKELKGLTLGENTN